MTNWPGLMKSPIRPIEKKARKKYQQQLFQKTWLPQILIPEQGEEEQIFAEEEIHSIENNAPDWLQELGESDSRPSPFDADEINEETPPATGLPAPGSASPKEADLGTDLLPDWLTDLGDDEPAPESLPEPVSDQHPAESSDIPDWLGDFESGVSDPEEDSSSLDWLDNLSEKQADPAPDQTSEPFPASFTSADSENQIPEVESELSGEVSPNDETLNTQVPDWLTNIGEREQDGEDKEFGESASWLDEIDKPIEGETETEVAATDGEVLNWLEKMEDQPEEPSSIDDLRESLTGDLEEKQKPIELETAKYLPQEEEPSDSLPDWLSELAGDESEEPTSLENAIRQSDHSLSSEEKEFLEQAEVVHDENSDWLAKLDLTDDEAPLETETPAIKVDLPEDPQSLDSYQAVIPAESDITGGILDRLNDPGESQEQEVPQWLENLKKEEDPQETAILWLKQFVERGNDTNLQDEIKRYTDELNPGDTVPKWMEDLKHEEDPQTTAMLWLEKLAGERPAPEPPKPPKPEVEAGWLAELEKEVSDQSREAPEEPAKDFQDTSDGWLADLEIDEKLKSEEPDLPDWSDPKTEESQEGDTPMWMKATSPLEGDFHTDELAGMANKEVEIPAWLAGYGEGEEPEEEIKPEAPEPAAETEDQDEYAWVSETDTPSSSKPSKEPIDLNKAAISQLESILGISYQVAQGIVIYREKQGPFKELKDLLNVPQITDEQTIEILKPEVFIQPVEEKPKPKAVPKPAAKDTSIDERLQLAKALLSELQIAEALEHYSFLIKKKKSVAQVIDDLVQATADFPVDIMILKVLGDAYMRIDKLDDALKAYSKAEDLLG